MTSENVNKTVAYFMCHSAIFPANVRYFCKMIFFRRPGTHYMMPLYKLQKCSLCANPDPQAHGYMTRVWARFQPPSPPWPVAFAQCTN